ncbi:MAG TPA: biotin--[acetyl-CoA-carboxylase] ligase [Vicinamibacterales bacterium]|nr:biotin--[acetyl-CoA-carboxylase] ligase [Vicinamibacterales bacterium]
MKSNPPDALADAIARARPRLGRVASTVLFFETIGSTNDEAAKQSAAGGRSAEGLVVVADEQTAGRGRRGHAWFSPAGSGLYVSVVLAPATATTDPGRATTLLTLAAGVALAEGIEQAAGLRIDLKWPNDLLVCRRKLGGILAESSGSGDRSDTVVVGYGINVRPTAFPPELRDRATSLESELGRAIDRHHVLAETLAALSRRYEDLLAGRFDAILDAWRDRAPGASGARVTWTSKAGESSGVTAGIDDLGALLVRVADRVERIVSGEVAWI